MLKRKIVLIFLIFFLAIIFVITTNSKKNSKKNQIINLEESTSETENTKYNSNIIKNIKYVSKDAKGNEYIVEALEGEIDYTNPNIIFLKQVNALIKLKSSDKVLIISDYGKYNSDNFDTIFSKNVKVNYLDNKITSEYLDFSLLRNLMIISKNVVYTNMENILKSDVVEINIETKDTKIFMYENNKKVNIKSIN